MILQLEVSGKTASRSRALLLRQCHGSRGSGPPVFRHEKLENAVSRVLQGSPGDMTQQVLNPVPGSGGYRYRRENHPRCDIRNPPRKSLAPAGRTGLRCPVLGSTANARAYSGPRTYVARDDYPGIANLEWRFARTGFYLRIEADMRHMTHVMLPSSRNVGLRPEMHMQTSAPFAHAGPNCQLSRLYG